MKVTRDQIKKLIGESVKKITESADEGINWDNLTYLNKGGKLSRLSPKWQVILLARQLAGNDFERMLAILKSAVATLEAKKSSQPPAEDPSGEPEGSLDFASLVTGK